MIDIRDRLKWIKDEFDRIAQNGFLGDPSGEPAYGYLRVSSTGQAEEGRSGFPRQLQHVHEKAKALHLAIPWELVYFDDDTGFEFRNRTQLTALRELVRSTHRPADHLVIENLDRLSREATWHQGYLLEEFEKEHKVKIYFWKDLPSTLERVVYGTIAQDRMLTDLDRMHKGTLIKAESGRVTARTPAYGYQLVNSYGGMKNAKKDTHYAFREPEAGVMRQVYRWLVEERATMGWISLQLTQNGVIPPKRSRTWEPSLLRVLVQNSVYKGEFYANRSMEIQYTNPDTGKVTTRKVKRPENEWILVKVPALVTPEVWAEAQGVMKENKSKSLRNCKRQYLLTGLTICADCKPFAMTTGGRYHYKMTRDGEKQYEVAYYRCQNRARPKHIVQALGCTCTMPQIVSKRLDDLVWNTVITALLDRTRLEEGMERYFSRQKQETTKDELVFVQTQLTQVELEDEKLYQAYVAGAFEADEYAVKRRGLWERKKRLEDEKEKLQKRFAQQSSREEQKQQILASVDELRRRADEELPFELKRKILLRVVDKVIVNTREEWFELEGAISGKFDFIPACVVIMAIPRGSVPAPRRR